MNNDKVIPHSIIRPVLGIEIRYFQMNMNSIVVVVVVGVAKSGNNLHDSRITFKVNRWLKNNLP